jgi:hypothetical protein
VARGGASAGGVRLDSLLAFLASFTSDKFAFSPRGTEPAAASTQFSTPTEYSPGLQSSYAVASYLTAS